MQQILSKTLNTLKDNSKLQNSEQKISISCPQYQESLTFKYKGDWHLFIDNKIFTEGQQNLKLKVKPKRESLNI